MSLNIVPEVKNRMPVWGQKDFKYSCLPSSLHGCQMWEHMYRAWEKITFQNLKYSFHGMSIAFSTIIKVEPS